MAFTKIKSFRFFLVCITLHNIQDILAKTPWQKSCRTFGSIFLNTPNQYASSHLHILLRGGETVRNTTISNTTQNLIFHATKPGDGSSTDPDGIPNRFLIMQKQNRMKAKKAFEATLSWRSQYKVDSILSRPHPKYDQCKSIISHFFSGRDVQQNPIFVQQLGKIRFDLIKKNNLTADDLLLHYVYTLEYCWNILEPNITSDGTEGFMTSVLDLDGVGWTTFQDKEFIKFAKQMVSMISSHYPTRSYKTLIINAPKWVGAVYTLFKPLLRKSTRAKMEIFKQGSKEQEIRLRELLGDGTTENLIRKTVNMISFIDWSQVKVEELNHPGPFSSIEIELRDIVSIHSDIFASMYFIAFHSQKPLFAILIVGYVMKCLHCLKNNNMTMSKVLV